MTTSEKAKALKVLQLAIDIGELRTRSQMLAIHADNDGRIRAGYNIVGTETSRITCYTSPTGSGYNLQTIPDENTLRREGDFLRQGMRDLFVADEGCYLFKCDLSGADGWTIGAHLFSLGKPAMLEDLKAKIKPAARICYMLRHGNDSLKGKTRDEVKELLKEVKSSDWDYFACKQGIWGITYLMGPDKLAEVILVGSEGKVQLSRDDVRSFRNAVYAAYEPNVWHEAVGRRLKAQQYPPSLVDASGHTRKFFGRPTEILGQALAHEPQCNTTFCVKKALYRLWNDPENRDNNRLKVEPLHTVHDSLDGQFKTKDIDWAVSKIREWFDNPIIIAGQKITIPFSGSYGTNWALDEKSKVGEI